MRVLLRLASLWLGPAVLVCTLAAGGPFWLKKVGWYQPQFLAEYQQVAPDASIEDAHKTLWLHALTERMYQHDGFERALKLLRDVLLILLSLLGAWYCWYRQLWRPWQLMAGLAVLVLAMGLSSTVQNGALVAIAGLRGLLFLGLAVFVGCLAGDQQWRRLSRWLTILVIVQLPALLFEVLHGVHLFYSLSFAGGRAVGWFLQPSTLGLMVAMTMVLSTLYEQKAGWRVLSWLAGVLSIWLSGSAGGVAVLLLVGLSICLPWLRARWWRLASAAAAGLGVIAVLPTLLGRAHLYDSLFGRLELLGLPLQQAFWLGQGLGANSNTARLLLAEGGQTLPLPADSTLAALLTQFGAIGTGAIMVLVAGLVWRSSRQDMRLLSLWVALLSASLVTHLPEAWALNLLLGLLLARCWPARYRLDSAGARH